VTDWFPISKAPLDGTHIIVINVNSPHTPPATVHYFDGGWHLSVNQRGEYSEYIWGPPTHWTWTPQIPVALRGTREGETP
jgi:hypothetical protein